MNLRNLIGAAAIAFSGAALSVAPAQAVSFTYEGTGPLVEGGVVSNPISIGDVYLINIMGMASDGGGSATWKFTATEQLIAIETNSLNPIVGFQGAQVSWLDQFGAVVASISGQALIDGDQLITSFGENEMKFLVAEWTDVTMDFSDFDLRVEATAIPLPASVLMLLAALGGLGALSRRGKSAMA